MEPAADEFTFQPLPPIEDPASAALHAERLGPLAGLRGRWGGGGFNVIWRPRQVPGFPRQDHFLELNMTSEELDFGPTLGKIPNRGLLEPDISLAGLKYVQQVFDINLSAAQHFEPGLWVYVPRTGDPQEPPTVVRMASIPHGTTILAQGTASTSAGPPTFPPISITPFPIGHPDQPQDFAEQHLDRPTPYRTAGAGLHGVTQAMLDNPNSVLAHAPLIAGQDIETTTTLRVFTNDAAFPGGGTANIGFLTGAAQGPNAHATHVSATFWLQTPKRSPEPIFLQYSQRVLLQFDGFSWPHVTVATLELNLP